MTRETNPSTDAEDREPLASIPFVAQVVIRSASGPRSKVGKAETEFTVPVFAGRAHTGGASMEIGDFPAAFASALEALAAKIREG